MRIGRIRTWIDYCVEQIANQSAKTINQNTNIIIKYPDKWNKSLWYKSWTSFMFISKPLLSLEWFNIYFDDLMQQSGWILSNSIAILNESSFSSFFSWVFLLAASVNSFFSKKYFWVLRRLWFLARFICWDPLEIIAQQKYFLRKHLNVQLYRLW